MKINSKAPIPLLVLLLGAAVSAGPIQLMEQLRIDYRVMVNAERDYRLRREHGGLSGVEASDYAGYLAKLVRRVAEDCVALAQSGSRLPRDIDCPAPPAASSSAAQIDQRGELTGAEQIAALDAELNAGLGEFDEMLLREQERVKAAAPRSDVSVGGSDGMGDGEGSGESGTADGRENGEPGNDNESTQSGSSEGGSSGGGDSAGKEGGMGPGNKTKEGGQPADIPDGSDDDLVARQLREAAEKETDPELKAKLWEEYRKYKQGTR